MMSSKVDEAFWTAGQTPGLEIWRIEKLKVVAQDKSTYSEFFSGDSYIVLHTKKKVNSDKLEWNIHFWLGNETSQDEQGVAAYKTVELDDHLGGAPVQHREVQDHESKAFLSYFPHGIKYLSGGIESGFKKVEKGVYEKRLFHIKGKRNVRVKQVKCHCSSLNQGDVFLLDCGLTLHLWIGPTSSYFERIKGAEVANRIRDEERFGKAEVRIIDNRWNSDLKFFEELGSQVEITETAGDDSEYERSASKQIKLYSVSDASGQLEVTEVQSTPIKQSDLDPNDCFILDTGSSGIFVWIGRSCTTNEKRSAWKHATDFLTLKGYPEWTKVTRVVENGETPVFKQYFKSWTTIGDQTGLGSTHTRGSIAKADSNGEIDIKKLHTRLSIDMPSSADDVTAEKMCVWQVKGNDFLEVPAEDVGVFFSTSCYVLLHTFRTGTRRRCYVYYWQGLRSSFETKAASAIHAQRVDEEETSGDAIQIRVVQGQEPANLLRVFSGKMVVYMDDDDDADPNPVKMFHIRGTNVINTRSVEVKACASSLNSLDIFVIIAERVSYVWIGKIAESTANNNLIIPSQVSRQFINPDRDINTAQVERDMSDIVVELLAAHYDTIYINESEETSDFWETLGGQKEYAKAPRNNNNSVSVEPRLFLCSNTSGRFRVDEISQFTQEDLSVDDVMILDAYYEIYVWIGSGANLEERRESLKNALSYLQADETGRSEENTVLVQIKHGHEPASFTSHFHGWDDNKWKVGMNQTSRGESKTASVKEELAKFYAVYSYNELRSRVLPDGVDPTCKEMYLSDAEFEEVFGINRVRYLLMPKWKQLNLKKKVLLF